MSSSQLCIGQTVLNNRSCSRLITSFNRVVLSTKWRCAQQAWQRSMPLANEHLPNTHDSASWILHRSPIMNCPHSPGHRTSYPHSTVRTQPFPEMGNRTLIQVWSVCWRCSVPVSAGIPLASLILEETVSVYYSTWSPFVTLLSRRAQSGRWSFFGKRVWFSESHIVLIISFYPLFYLLNLLLIKWKKGVLYRVTQLNHILLK